MVSKADVANPMSDRYLAFRSALLQIKEDSSAMVSVLGAQSDNGVVWVNDAYAELRHELIGGKLEDSKEIGELIQVVLQAQEGGSEDELAENQLHKKAYEWVKAGISAVLGQDAISGIDRLENLPEAVYCNESLPWVAWLWVCRAALDMGDLPKAQIAGERMLEFAGRLDQAARNVSLEEMGEVTFLKGEFDVAQKHLKEAKRGHEEAENKRGIASCFLLEARIFAATSQFEKGKTVAEQAHSFAPDWAPPLIFLVRLALLNDDLDEAEIQLGRLLALDPPPVGIEREQKLVHLAKKGRIPHSVLTDYLRFQSQPPNEEMVDVLEQMIFRNNNFWQLRELLAWNLLKMGRDDEAQFHFEILNKTNEDPLLQISVLFGLSCLAMRNDWQLFAGLGKEKDLFED
ncbi:MAG: hypothetical protein V1754_06055, partial [Pseudomonadota bacterium]